MGATVNTMNTIDFKDLILADDVIDVNNNGVNNKNGANNTAVKAAKKTYPEFEQVVGSGIDFAITKKTKSTDMMLVILISKKQYYIKNNKKGTIELLTTDNLSKFFTGNTDDNPTGIKEIKNVTWIDTVPKGMPSYQYLIDVLNNIDVELFKKGLIYVNPNRDVQDYKPDKWESTVNKIFGRSIVPEYEKYTTGGVFNTYGIMLEILKCLKVYLKENPENELNNLTETQRSEQYMNIFRSGRAYVSYLYHPGKFPIVDKLRCIIRANETMRYIYENYGLDNVKDFISCYLELPTAVQFSRCARYGVNTSNLFGEDIRFNYTEFKNYILHESLRQGYADNREGITGDWVDTLALQKHIFGEIRDKYPENLATLHNRLSYIMARNQEEIDKQMFTKRSEKAKEYAAEFTKDGKEYIVKTPIQQADFSDEATQQSNCVAGYVKKFIEGICTIVFLRKKKTDYVSWVTVEINNNNEIVQAKMKYNHNLDPEATKALTAYAKKVGLTIRPGICR